MPIHDWTRVNAGTWHDFHVAWITEIRNALNMGLLPPDYYAQAEQIAGPLGPDVLTLQEAETPSFDDNGSSGSEKLTSVARTVATAPPRSQWTAEAQMDDYVLKRRTIIIRHQSNDRIIALLEIVSPGNKSSRHAICSFVEKGVKALYRGYHLLVVDMFPPTVRDPQGVHELTWKEISDVPFTLAAETPLVLAAYSAGLIKRAYVEPTAVGQELLEMPLFLDEETYVNVPLESTYQRAYQGVARRWRRVLEAPQAGDEI